MDIVERYDVDPVRAWIGTVLAIAGVLVAGAVLFPRRVYDGFLWQYFWGPVVADAHGASCAQRVDGETQVIHSAAECATATGVVAEPGYTTISTLSYVVVLVLALVGVVFLLRRLEVGTDPGFFYALFPFALFGGALRTVEDANVALLREGSTLLPLPWTALIISPFIYFTVFFVATAALVVGVLAARRGMVDRYEYPLAGVGVAGLLVTMGTLAWLTVTTDVVGFFLVIPTVVLVGATVLTAAVWVLIERYAPHINAGTGYMGALVIWGHTVDGVANVLSLDWATEIGLPGEYAPKHVANRLIIQVTESIQPAAVSDTIGTAWPFLFVKIAAAVFIVWVFDDRFFEDSPRFAMMLFVAVLAVGLGPGTRDMLRATFGI